MPDRHRGLRDRSPLGPGIECARSSGAAGATELRQGLPQARQERRGRCRGDLRGGDAANHALPAGAERRAARGAGLAYVATDPIRQLQRVLDVTDNQVRSLRRRDLIARYRAAQAAETAGKLDPNRVDPYARFGTYWGIDTDPAKVTPAGSLPCASATIHQLA